MANLPDPLSPIVAHTPPWDAQTLEGAVRAWTERVVDAVFDGRRAALESEFDTLRRSYRLISAHLEVQAEEQPEYFLGRVASLLEVAGSAHQRTRPDEWEDEVKEPLTREILQLLRKESLRPTDVAAHLGLTLGAISRRLTALAEARIVVPTRTGREVRYRLSRAAEEMVKPAERQAGSPMRRVASKLEERRKNSGAAPPSYAHA